MTAITVVTTTYNRRALLERCYQSLLEQSSRDFDWLIVDDGSTDTTTDAVALWQTEADFAIRLIHKSNGGKHTALNRAFASDLGDYVLLLDSDDLLAREGIQRVMDALQSVRDGLPAGLIGHTHDLVTGRVVGLPLPSNVGLTTGRELRERHGVTGDTLRVYRADLLAHFAFPEFAGERFMPENVLFDEIDAHHRVVVTHEVIHLCDYQDDGLSSNIQRHRALSHQGFAAGLESTAWISRRPRWIVEYTLKYQVWSRVFRGDYGRKGFRRRIAFWLCLPVAATLHRLRRPSFIFQTLEWRQSPSASDAPG